LEKGNPLAESPFQRKRKEKSYDSEEYDSESSEYSSDEGPICKERIAFNSSQVRFVASENPNHQTGKDHDTIDAALFNYVVQLAQSTPRNPSQNTHNLPQNPLSVPIPPTQPHQNQNQHHIEDIAQPNLSSAGVNHATIADLVRICGSHQDNQTMMLLQNITPFSGVPSLKGLPNPRFETWIRTFESIVDMGNFEDAKKIKLLSSKLI
jgi:hypothetical protein